MSAFVTGFSRRNKQEWHITTLARIAEAKDGWGKLKSGAGWIYLGNPSYCTVQGAAATNRTYTVKAGDSLWAIAAKQLGNGSRYKEIKSLNGLTSDVINAGQVLKLPN